MEIALSLLEIGGLTASSYLFFSLQDKKYKLEDLLNFINQATVFNPELLKKILSGQAPRTYFESLRDFEEGKDYVRGMAFVQGIVDAKSPLLSKLNQSTRLVFSSISMQSLFSNKSKLGFSKETKTIKAVENFSLKDPNYDSNHEVLPLSLYSKITELSNIFSSDDGFKARNLDLPMFDLRKTLNTHREIPSIDIRLTENGKNTQMSPALELIDSTTSTRVLTSVETMMSYLLKALKFFLSLSSISKKIQGFRIGYKKIERGIKLSQFIVAFGEVFYDRKTNTLKMENPLCLLKNKNQMLKKLRLKKVKLSRRLSFAFCLMTLMGLLVVRRAVKGVKGLVRRMKKMKESKKMEKLLRLSEEINDDYKCIICYDLAKHIIFKPCLHMACCRNCYEKLENNKCIICKREIDEVVTIYVK